MIKPKIKWGARFEVNNGPNTLFWEDTWLGEVPLKTLFPKIYDYCCDKNARVADVCLG